MCVFHFTSLTSKIQRSRENPKIRATLASVFIPETNTHHRVHDKICIVVQENTGESIQKTHNVKGQIRTITSSHNKLRVMIKGTRCLGAVEWVFNKAFVTVCYKMHMVRKIF